MSMNLECEQVPLWQTPTYITYMCYSNGDGGWKGILYRYSRWVESHSNGVYHGNEGLEDLKRIKKDIEDHLKQFEGKKKLNFYVV